MQTDSAPVTRVMSRTTPTPDTPRVSSANLETLDETLDVDMTLDDIDGTSDDIDATPNNFGAAQDNFDATMDNFGTTLDNLNALPSSPNLMSTESPPPRRASTESPVIPGHTSSPASLVPLTNRAPSQSRGPWTPSHRPSWILGPQHRQYVHAAAPYLLGVPGGADWENLLVSYITFESLSADRSVSNLHTESPILLADGILGFVETPDQPTPQRTCTMV